MSEKKKRRTIPGPNVIPLEKQLTWHHYEYGNCYVKIDGLYYPMHVARNLRNNKYSYTNSEEDLLEVMQAAYTLETTGEISKIQDTDHTLTKIERLRLAAKARRLVIEPRIRDQSTKYKGVLKTMANISSAYGTLAFNHTNSNTKPALIEKFVQFSIENFGTGGLMFPEQFNSNLDTSDEWIWSWGDIYDFESEGRWSMRNTLEAYFESFEKAPFKDDLVGMQLTLDFIDYERGSNYLVKQHIEMEAGLDQDGKLKTIQHVAKLTDIKYNAPNLVQYKCVDWAYDTTTTYGVDKYLSYIGEFIAENPTTFADNTELIRLIKNKRRIPINDWLQAFKSCSVDVLNDFDDYSDASNIVDVLIDTDVMSHPLIKPYTK